MVFKVINMLMDVQSGLYINWGVWTWRILKLPLGRNGNKIMFVLKPLTQRYVIKQYVFFQNSFILLLLVQCVW